MALHKASFILIILYLGFVSLGLPDQTLGVAWPFMRQTFDQPLDAAGLPVLLLSLLTALSGFSTGFLRRHFSIATILTTSAALTASGLLGYALSPHWGFLIACTIPLGLGAGAIDASLNSYVAEHYPSRQMNWLHGCWGIGAALGPALMTTVIAQGLQWSWGYVLIAGIQFSLVLLFLLSRSCWDGAPVTAPAPVLHGVQTRLWTPAAVLSVGLFPLYTMVEGSLGLWFYSVMVDGLALAPGFAGALIVLYWGMLTVGRFGIGLVSDHFGNRRIIVASLTGALIGLLLLLGSAPWMLAAGLSLTGLSLAAIYPSMMHETPRRFGVQRGAAITGFQAGAGALGVGLLIPVVGVIIAAAGLHWLIPLLIAATLLMLLMQIVLDRLT